MQVMGATRSQKSNGCVKHTCTCCKVWNAHSGSKWRYLTLLAYIKPRLLPTKLVEINSLRSNRRETLSVSTHSYYEDRRHIETNARTHGYRHSNTRVLERRNKAERLRAAEMGEKMTVSLAFRGLSRVDYLERDLSRHDT